MEALEDFEDIQRREQLPRWHRYDPRLRKLHQIFEGYSPVSNPSTPSNPPLSSDLSPRLFPSVKNVVEVLGGLEGKDGLEIVVNYMIDLLTRSRYLLDKQINAIEQKHKTEGGYKENLLKKRLEYRKSRF